MPFRIIPVFEISTSKSFRFANIFSKERFCVEYARRTNIVRSTYFAYSKASIVMDVFGQFNKTKSNSFLSSSISVKIFLGDKYFVL